jgi:redox-sensitive bicupin YhaK (pirin superfamily)
MKIEIHPSSERGVAEHGWLHSKHSFSFAEYYNPNRMGFGVLRVINEDIVEPGRGLSAHSHDNMEIVSVVLDGALEHKDSMGNHGIIPAGDIQRMSAGTGVTHSEFNHSKTDVVHFLQIWVYPKERNIKPSYEQRSFPPELRKNKLLPVVSGIKSEGSVYIHQDAAFLIGSLDEGVTVSHGINSPNHGVYVFVIKGGINIDGKNLGDGDAAGITDTDVVKIKANKETDVLVIEVPLVGR